MKTWNRLLRALGAPTVSAHLCARRFFDRAGIRLALDVRMRKRTCRRATAAEDAVGKQAQMPIAAVGGTATIHEAPSEMTDAVPFAHDTRQRPYDRAAVERYHQALLSIERVFSQFRTSFLGKVSPVHLFWGAFDLAVTRFSGAHGRQRRNIAVER